VPADLGGNSSEEFFYGRFEGAGIGAAEAAGEGFEFVDEPGHVTPGVGPAGGLAEVGAAAERPGIVDEAFRGGGIEQRAGTVSAGWQRAAAGGFERLRGDEGFAGREVGGFSGEQELAAFGAQRAAAREGTCGEFGVDFPDIGGGQFAFSGDPFAAGGHDGILKLNH